MQNLHSDGAEVRSLAAKVSGLSSEAMAGLCLGLDLAEAELRARESRKWEFYSRLTGGDYGPDVSAELLAETKTEWLTLAVACGAMLNLRKDLGVES